MSGYPTANTAPAIKPLVYTLPYSAFSSGTTAYTLNLGSPPPSGAYLSAFQLTVPAEWTHSGGTSAITMDLGWVGNPTALAAGIDVLDSSSINITGPSAGVSGGTATDQYDVGGKQLTIRITTTGGNTNTLTGGSVTVSVWVVQQLANLPFVAEFVANIGGGPTPINQLGATTVDITNITTGLSGNTVSLGIAYGSILAPQLGNVTTYPFTGLASAGNITVSGLAVGDKIVAITPVLSAATLAAITGGATIGMGDFATTSIANANTLVQTATGLAGIAFNLTVIKAV